MVKSVDSRVARAVSVKLYMLYGKLTVARDDRAPQPNAWAQGLGSGSGGGRIPEVLLGQ